VEEDDETLVVDVFVLMVMLFLVSKAKKIPDLSLWFFVSEWTENLELSYCNKVKKHCFGPKSKN
jgi:hypothetical protein